jgi:hypothetical protein
MKAGESLVQRKLRLAGALLVLGLLAEIVSLVWEKPLAFILFVGVGGTLTLIGLILYLYSLVNPDSAS